MSIDLNNGFTELREHVGHSIACVAYGGFAPREGQPVNVAIECEDCGVVLLDFDNPVLDR